MPLPPMKLQRIPTSISVYNSTTLYLNTMFSFEGDVTSSPAVYFAPFK
jgi:hypothetical protein